MENSTQRDALVRARAEGRCELCSSGTDLEVYEVPPTTDDSADHAILLCAVCREQVTDPAKMEPNHWRCLNDSMWAPVPAVQVMAWRMLTRLRGEGWPQDMLDMLYLEDEVLVWAQSTEGAEGGPQEDAIQHKDSNGALLAAGDTVTLVKDLPVKGAGFTAKRGTAVRNISLVAENADHIEGRVQGQQIIILTKFVKKST